MRRFPPRLVRTGPSSCSSERGTALIGVLLLLLMMTALVSALAISGQTETLVARNHESLAQARTAAEAGVNHATQAVLAWLAQWPASYASADAALDDLLTNTATVIDADDFDFGATYTIASNITYEVDLLDDSGPGEDADPLTDSNGIITIRAYGFSDDYDTRVELEAIIGPYTLPAIISDGDLDVGASVTIVAGDNGGIHANGDLTFTGANLITGIDPVTGLPDPGNGSATATGSYSAPLSTVVTGDYGDAYTKKRVPNVRASFYRSWADFVLESTGQLTCNVSSGCMVDGTPYASGQTICDASANPHNQCRGGGGDPEFGWIYDDSDMGWTFQPVGGDPEYADGYTFYVEGPVRLSGSPGSVADPVNITIIAEGSIDVSGSPNLTPDSTEIMFVTDGDLDISGNLNMPLAEGQILVHEQVDINASAAVILGQLVIEDAEDVDDLVTRATAGIQGVTITYTGDVGNSLYDVTGWREVR